MDHFPPVARPHNPISVPYLGGKYDGGSFVGFPARQGWDLAKLQAGDSQGRPPEDAAQFLQAWLYFGLLNEILDIHVDTEDFVCRDNKQNPTVSTKELRSYLGRWKETDTNWRNDQIIAALSDSYNIWRGFEPEARSRFFSPEIELSIQLLAVTLEHAVTSFNGISVNNAPWRLASNAFLTQRMIDEGWCPSLVQQIWFPTHLAVQYYASLLGPLGSHLDHRNCTAGDIGCKSRNVVAETYRTKHLQASCDCEFLGPGLESLHNIIQTGDIPVVYLEVKDQDVTVKVTPLSENVSYTAISHVWSDGLGNPHENKLPKCQLQEMSRRLAKFSTASIGKNDEKERAYFWIDTLCVPVQSEKLRNAAITSMQWVYGRATRVLVLDADLMASTVRTNEEEKVARITCSGWVRRLWTLQEAIFASEIHYQFAEDSFVIPPETASERKNQYREYFDDEIRYYCRAFELDLPQGPTLELLRIVRVWQNLKNRSTSKASDQPICIATLLRLDLAALLDGPKEDRVRRLWGLHKQVPAGVLFIPGKKMKDATYGWAPASCEDLRWIGPPMWTPATVTTRGLEVCLSGFVLDSAIDPTEAVIACNVDGDIVYVRRNMKFGSESWDSLNLHDSKAKLAVVLGMDPMEDRSQRRPLVACLGALLSIVSHEDNVITAKYIRFVSVIKKSSYHDAHANPPWSDVEEAEKLRLNKAVYTAPDQKWCIGSSYETYSNIHEFAGRNADNSHGVVVTAPDDWRGRRGLTATALAHEAPSVKPGSVPKTFRPESKAGDISKSDVDRTLAESDSGSPTITFAHESFKDYVSQFIDTSLGPVFLSRAIRYGDVQRASDLIENNLDGVAQKQFHWLLELVEMGYRPMEIARLLCEDQRDAPWIHFVRDDKLETHVDVDHHRRFCMHQGGRKIDGRPRIVTANSEAIETTRQNIAPEPPTEEAKNITAQFTGLGGVAPISHDITEWSGTVIFDLYDCATGSVSYRTGTPTEKPERAALQRIDIILRDVIYVFGKLQHLGLFCNCFTILSMRTPTPSIEVVHIDIALIITLQDELQRALVGKSDICSCTELWEVAKKISTLFGFLPNNDNSMRPDSSGRTTEVVVDLCSLTTQLVCLGVLSYSFAHIGPFHPFFLDRPVKKINLLGFRTNVQQSHGSVELFRLTCLEGLVKGPVLAFRPASRSVGDGERFDILASPLDLIDTWGPGEIIRLDSPTGSRKIWAIKIGGGCITSSLYSPKLHWQKGLMDFEKLSKIFDISTKCLFGATSHNRQCPLDELSCLNESASLLHNLGTNAEYFRLVERHVDFGLAQYGIIQGGNTWARIEATTLKDRHLDMSPNELSIPFLSSPWGLEISLCTGAARRVSLLELLSEVIQTYVEACMPVPKGWNELLRDHQLPEKLRSPDFPVWLQQLDYDLQLLTIKLIRYTLEVLKPTGIDMEREELVIAWALKQDPFRCFRVYCNKSNFWARILADSPHCATFACMTTKCLETSTHKCRNSSNSAWHSITASLDTSVCYHQSGRDSAVRGSNWTLTQQMEYWIGKPGTDLKVKIIAPASLTPPQLMVYRSKIPEWIQCRMGRTQRIRERQSLDPGAKEVLILASKE